MPGTPVFYDGCLADMYVALKKEGKILYTFCDEDKTMDSFISYFDRIKTAQILCEVEQDERLTLKPVGISWVDNPRGPDGARVMMGGMAFIGDVTKRPAGRGLAKLVLAYVFEDLKIDSLQGLQHIDNIAGRNFFKKIGFKEDAIVHDHFSIGGQLVDARVLLLRKEDFWPGFIDWKDAEGVLP